MGSKNSSSKAEIENLEINCDMTEKCNKYKILCLHGWRTSGKIMSMQTAALRYNTTIDCSFIDAPYVANGDPDAGIAMIYSEEKYYEWYYKDSIDIATEINHSLSLIIQHIKDFGPFDGIMGFSQGAAMATRIASMQSLGDKRLESVPLFKFIVLIGGVVPIEPFSKDIPINLRSLHIAGLSDPLLPRSRALIQLYSEHNRKVLEHSEGHNIPSMRTDLYPAIKQWIYGEERAQWVV